MTAHDERWIAEVQKRLLRWRQDNWNNRGGRCLEAIQVALKQSSSPELQSPMNTALNCGAAYLQAVRYNPHDGKVLCADGKLRPISPYYGWRVVDPIKATWGIGFYHGCGKVRRIFAGHVALVFDGKMADNNAGQRFENYWWDIRRFVVLQPEWG